MSLLVPRETREKSAAGHFRPHNCFTMREQVAIASIPSPYGSRAVRGGLVCIEHCLVLCLTRRGAKASDVISDQASVIGRNNQNRPRGQGATTQFRAPARVLWVNSIVPRVAARPASTRLRMAHLLVAGDVLGMATTSALPNH